MNLFILGSGYEWIDISLNELEKNENVRIINERFPVSGKIKKKLAWIHFSHKMNNTIKAPFKSIWYPEIEKKLGINKHKNEDNCLIIYDQNMVGGDRGFIEHLRKTYTGLKLVYMFTNVVRISAASINGYVENLNEWYDIVYAFDPRDSEEYGFDYCPLIYDAYESVPVSNNKKKITEISAFYLGLAKDRLDMLLAIYKRLDELGIKTNFNIVNVEENRIQHPDKIIYNKRMSYKEAVDCIKASDCLIDVIQGQSSGLTIKICEAIAYKKKIITTNKEVVRYPFYDSRFIRVIDNADDIDLAFFVDNSEVIYPKEGEMYFSAYTFLKRLSKHINTN